VFHDYGAQANGHGNNEWFKHQKDRFRKEAVTRAKTIIQLPGGDPTVTAQANLGLYGLGKRRTLQQLFEFGRIKVENDVGNTGKVINCVGHEWVPYDASISPVANLFDRPDNLDPQPEYPLRTNMIYYQQVDQAVSKIHVSINDKGDAEVKERGLRNPAGLPSSAGGGEARQALDFPETPPLPSFSLLFVLWAFGLIVWCVLFMNPQKSSGSGVKKRKLKKKKFSSDKDV